ncbi:MAG TPA: type I methionyl aminopeptidase [Spirochaetota bacterium]|nr:type I methionyl aminopeptidase [Spirochaetota bacterium]
MSDIYSPAEQEILKQSGKILAGTFTCLEPYIKNGTTTATLDEIAYDYIDRHNALPSFLGYMGFPASICTSVNKVLLHGIPDNTPLQNGDILTVDIGVRFRGLCTDRATTYIINNTSPAASRIACCARTALYESIKAALPGNHTGDIGFVIENTARKNGFQTVTDYTGHGVGREVHSRPQIPNYGPQGSGAALKTGMCLAIEAMLTSGARRCYTLKDNWSAVPKDNKINAHAEHTILVTAEGPEIITA